jgi:hypothetical protein
MLFGFVIILISLTFQNSLLTYSRNNCFRFLTNRIKNTAVTVFALFSDTNSSLHFDHGIKVDSLSHVIEYLQMHEKKIENWKSNFPSSQEITVSLQNINTITQFLKRFDEVEFIVLEDRLKREIKDLKFKLTFITNELQEVREKFESERLKYASDKQASTAELHEVKAVLHGVKDELHGVKSLFEREIEKSERATAELHEVKASLELQQQLIYLSDLSSMFRFYIANAKVGDWGRFSQSVSKMRDEYSEGEIDELSYRSFIDPKNELFGFDVASLIDFNQERNSFCHSGSIRKKSSQEAFLAMLENYEFRADMKILVDAMVGQLKLVPLRRME